VGVLLMAWGLPCLVEVLLMVWEPSYPVAGALLMVWEPSCRVVVVLWTVCQPPCQPPCQGVRVCLTPDEGLVEPTAPSDGVEQSEPRVGVVQQQQHHHHHYHHCHHHHRRHLTLAVVASAVRVAVDADWPPVSQARWAGRRREQRACCAPAGQNQDQDHDQDQNQNQDQGVVVVDAYRAQTQAAAAR